MGRKSRAKRENRLRREMGLSEEAFGRLNLSIDPGTSVYRYFPEEWQANALVNGHVWLSTLEACRQHEDPHRGDRREGTETYHSGVAVGDSGDPDFVKVAGRIGLRVGPGCTNNTVRYCTISRTLPDAYVLCTTMKRFPQELKTSFGKYCVEITKPTFFFYHVSAQLGSVGKFRQAAAGPVLYRDQTYVGLQDPPGEIGFVKSPDKYQGQKEFRFIWIPENSIGLAPFSLTCTNVKPFCQRIA